MEGCWRKEGKNQSVKWSWGKTRMVKSQSSQDRASAAKSRNIIWIEKHLIWFSWICLKVGHSATHSLWFSLKFQVRRGRAPRTSQWLQSWSLFCTGLLTGDSGHRGCACLRGTLLNTGGSRYQEYKKKWWKSSTQQTCILYLQTNKFRR